jgi:pimeloyl-ACP methyl ester carboxylesterase
MKRLVMAALSLFFPMIACSQNEQVARPVSRNVGGVSAERSPRFAVIDLGQDFNPLRVANNGWVLLTRHFDDNHGNYFDEYYRWKAGVLERLTYSTENSGISACDLNNQGVVVGSFNAGNLEGTPEPSFGLRWAENSSSAQKVSAPEVADYFYPPFHDSSRLVKLGSFSAINDKNEIFGQDYTGGGFVFTAYNINPEPILNACRWPVDLGAPIQLSHSHRIGIENGYFNWADPFDCVERANANGHYIGYRLSPGTPTYMFPLIFLITPKIYSAMVDGQAVSFYPVDINEAGTVLAYSDENRMVLWNGTTQIHVGSGYPVAINDRKRQTIQADGTVAPILSPQIIGYLNDESVLWERTADESRYLATNLEELIPDGTGWNLDDLVDLNDQGAIIGTGTYRDPTNSQATRDPHGFLLLPVELAVDSNRDGEMSLSDATIHDKDQTTEQKPYMFWINNNHDGYCKDSGETSVQDDLQLGPQDSSNDYISCTRDLEDFSRIWISMKGFSQILQGSSGISVGLQWEPIPGASGPTPTIKIFKAVESEGGTGYVTDNGSLPGDDLDWADQQIVGDYDVAVEDVNGNTVIGSNPFIMPNDFWNDLGDTHPKHLIFEGVTAGIGKLILVFIDSNGKKIGEGGALYMDLRDIKNMYERWSCEQTETQNGGDPNTQATLSPYRVPAGSLVYYYRANDPEEQKCILFVHGWNMSPFDKDAYAQTAFKRLWWQGYKGRFGAFLWPVTYHAYDLSAIYDFDDGEYTAWQSAIPLTGLLTTLNQRFGGNVYVVAHSMGNVVTGEALRLAAKSGAGQLVNTYVATQAAVPGHCYDMNLTNSNDLLDFGPLGFYGPSTPNIYNNWLGLAGSATGKRENFYNVNDFALNETHWQLDQKLKPDVRTYTYYYDSSDISVVQDLFMKAIIQGSGTPTILNLGNSSNVQDRYEIMAYASEPRSKALGGIPDVDAGIFTPQNLQSLWPPDQFAQANGPYSAHPWHSAQFRFTNADQHRYWQTLMEQFGLPTNNP